MSCTTITYRALRGGDIGGALALWSATPGIGLSSADEPTRLSAFIQANDGLCFCALEGDDLVGTILCGSDTRRGYLYHVAVAESARGRGIGRSLVERALGALGERGVAKCHAMVFAQNERGREFWTHIGWELRADLVVVSHSA